MITMENNCPYCYTALEEGDLVAICNACEIPHHVSCWEENRGCTTYACTCKSFRSTTLGAQEEILDLTKYFSQGDFKHQVLDLTTPSLEYIYSIDYPRDAIVTISWSPTGTYLAAGMLSGEMVIWETEKGTLKRIFYGHEGSITSISWSSAGFFLLSGSTDGRLGLWDLEKGKGTFIKRISSFFPFLKREKIVSGFSQAVSWSPYCHLLASIGTNRLIFIWDERGRFLNHIKSSFYHVVMDVAWSPKEPFLACAVGSTIRVYAGRSLQLVKVLKAKEILNFFPISKGHRERINSICWSSHGDWIVSGGDEPYMYLWDFSSKQVLSTLKNTDKGISCLSLSSCNQYLASIGKDKELRIWNLEGGSIISSMDNITDISWSPDGSHLAVANHNCNGNRIQLLRIH